MIIKKSAQISIVKQKEMFMKEYLVLSAIATSFLIIVLAHTYNSFVFRFLQAMISCILFASIAYFMKQYRMTRKQETFELLLRLKSFIYIISYICIGSILILLFLNHMVQIPNGIYNKLIIILLIVSIPTRVLYYLAIKEDR